MMLYPMLRSFGVVAFVVFALGGLGCQRPQAVGPSGPSERVAAYGFALELAPGIDRYSFFGPAGGPNMLYTRDLDAPAPVDPDHPEFEAYTFRGGCYTWVAPQNEWRDADGELRNWPPDPAMDRGPAVVVGRSLDGITTLTPTSWLGLRQRKSFTLTPQGGLLVYELINDGHEAIETGQWINTAVTTHDRIALYMPEGTELRGWDDDAVGKIESILSPPTTHGWRMLDLPHAGWRGGTKVWIDAPNGDATIAVWRHGRWLIRTMDRADPDGTLAAVGEGPVAVYIDPTDNLIEAELYAPIGSIPPGGSSRVSEYWELLPGRFVRPSPEDLVRPVW